jgi:hypothetical protein
MARRLDRRAGVRAWWLGVALGLAVGLPGRAGVSGAEATAPPEAAHWIAADAVIYLELPRPAALIDRLSDDRLRGPLAAIPSVKSALGRDDFRKLEAVAGMVAGKLGMTPEKALRGLAGGGIVFAVEAEAGHPPRAVLVVTPTDPGLLKDAGAALLELARRDAADKGKPDPVEQADYRGVTGYAVGPKVVYGILKDRLVIADRSETARTLIDRALDGPGAKASVADDPEWAARRAGVKADTLAWGHARLDRLRELDPKRFGGAGDTKPKPPPTLLAGGWIETVRKAPWVSVSVDWTEGRLAADLTLPVPDGGRGAAFKGFVPPVGAGAPGLVSPPGTVATLSLWRDFAALWEARADLFRPEDVQNLAKLDTFAGQFFGGRDFGTGVLGALASDWRLVVALQDYEGMSPAPDVKLPAFALVIDLKPDDDDFAQRLKVAFQSFIGLANLGTAQTKAPPLELGSEAFEGVTIATTHFMPARPAPGESATDPTGPKPAVHYRHNFSPSAVQVGDHFVISSSLGLARDLVRALKAPAAPGDATLRAEADGAVLARLVDLNRNRLVLQNMLEKGHDKEQADAEVGMLAALLRYLGHTRLSVRDAADTTRVGLEFALGR